MKIVAALILSLLFGATAHAVPLHLVYEGAGCTGAAMLPVYQQFLGKPVDGVTDFADYGSTWPNQVNELNWALGCWQGAKVANIDMSIGLAVTSGGTPSAQFKATIAGTNDSYWIAMAKAFAAHGFNAPFIRIAWEANGGWYPWAAASDKANFILAYQHVVAIFRTYAPGAKIIFCPTLGMQQVYPDQIYPGDSYVDVIAVDAYNQSWDAGVFLMSGVAIEPNLWKGVSGDSWGVTQVVAFAKLHGKPYAFPEWGTGKRPDGHGGGDDPAFITNMEPIVAGALFESYWDYNAGDYASSMTYGGNPKAAAAFFAAYSAPSALLHHNDAPFTTQNSLTVTCTLCHAEVLQNGPSHWNILVWAMGSYPNAKITWTGKTVNSNLYDPASKTPNVPTQATGQVNSVTLALTGYHPLILSVAE